MKQNINLNDVQNVVRSQAAMHLPEFDYNAWNLNHENPQGLRVRGATFAFVCSYILDLDLQSSYQGHITVTKKGQGLGTRLVKMREDICSELGIKHIIINNCTNPNFWLPRGYRPTNSDFVNNNSAMTYVINKPLMKVLENGLMEVKHE